MSLPAAVLCAALAAAAGDPPSAPGHPYHREQHANAPAELWAVIEVPLASAIKYEIDKATGHVFVDRFQSMPVTAPANYGSFPRTLAADDPLDAVVLSRHPVHPGAFVRVRPVGVIRTVDGEHKDIPRAERDRIAAYFRVYKQLPSGLENRILEFAGRDVAQRLVREAMEDYLKAGPARNSRIAQEGATYSAAFHLDARLGPA